MTPAEKEQLKEQIRKTAVVLDELFLNDSMPQPFPQYLNELKQFYIISAEKISVYPLNILAEDFKNIVEELKLVKNSHKSVEDSLIVVENIFKKMDWENTKVNVLVAIKALFWTLATYTSLLSIVTALTLPPISAAIASTCLIFGVLLCGSKAFEYIEKLDSNNIISTHSIFKLAKISKELFCFFKPYNSEISLFVSDEKNTSNCFVNPILSHSSVY